MVWRYEVERKASLCMMIAETAVTFAWASCMMAGKKEYVHKICKMCVLISSLPLSGSITPNSSVMCMIPTTLGGHLCQSSIAIKGINIVEHQGNQSD